MDVDKDSDEEGEEILGSRPNSVRSFSVNDSGEEEGFAGFSCEAILDEDDNVEMEENTACENKTANDFEEDDTDDENNSYFMNTWNWDEDFTPHENLEVLLQAALAEPPFYTIVGDKIYARKVSQLSCFNAIFECAECGYIFTRKSALLEHFKTTCKRNDTVWITCKKTSSLLLTQKKGIKRPFKSDLNEKPDISTMSAKISTSAENYSLYQSNHRYKTRLSVKQRLDFCRWDSEDDHNLDDLSDKSYQNSENDEDKNFSSEEYDQEKINFKRECSIDISEAESTEEKAEQDNSRVKCKVASDTDNVIHSVLEDIKKEKDYSQSSEEYDSNLMHANLKNEDLDTNKNDSCECEEVNAGVILVKQEPAEENGTNINERIYLNSSPAKYQVSKESQFKFCKVKSTNSETSNNLEHKCDIKQFIKVEHDENAVQDLQDHNKHNEIDFIVSSSNDLDFRGDKSKALSEDAIGIDSSEEESVDNDATKLEEILPPVYRTRLHVLKSTTEKNYQNNKSSLICDTNQTNNRGLNSNRSVKICNKKEESQEKNATLNDQGKQEKKSSTFLCGECSNTYMSMQELRQHFVGNCHKMSEFSNTSVSEPCKSNQGDILNGNGVNNCTNRNSNFAVDHYSDVKINRMHSDSKQHSKNFKHKKSLEKRFHKTWHGKKLKKGKSKKRLKKDINLVNKNKNGSIEQQLITLLTSSIKVNDTVLANGCEQSNLANSTKLDALKPELKRSNFPAFECAECKYIFQTREELRFHFAADCITRKGIGSI